MNVQITHFNNFIKITINNKASWSEISSTIKQFDKSLLEKTYSEYNNDSITYIFCDEQNNSYYSILYCNNTEVLINKRTFYNKNNPYTDNNFDWGDDCNDIPEFIRKFHVDDKIIWIDTMKKEYAIQNLKHSTQGTTFYNKAYNSNPIYKTGFYKFMQLNKDVLLDRARVVIEEIKQIENIEKVMDLSLFDLIPTSNNKRTLVAPSE